MKTESLQAVSPTIRNILLVAFLILSVFYVASIFGTNLRKDIDAKKELESLTKEKLRLEIQLKKLELSKNGK